MPICINALFNNSYGALFELRNIYIYIYISLHEKNIVFTHFVLNIYGMCFKER